VRFYTLDVFTDRPLSGNPLAVVLGGEGLDASRMQAIASEFNLSETVFVMPPEDQANRARLRIFTPMHELPFAGHPTVGTAVLLAHMDGGDADFVLEEKVGRVCVRVKNGNAVFDLPKLPTRTIVEADLASMANALGLELEDLGIEEHEYAVCDAGNAFPCLPVRSMEVLKHVNVNQQALTAFNRAHGVRDEIFLYAKPDLDNPMYYRARMFAPAMGISEDPATGSAVAAFAAQLMACEHLGDGNHDVIVEQGVEMGRPSRINLALTVQGGALVGASIGGSAVLVSEGNLLF